jgi:hypothetical protein
MARGKTGPATEAGKAAVRRNAITHGIMSNNPVIEGVQRKSDWHSHLEGIVASIAPEGDLEDTLARRLRPLAPPPRHAT